MSADPAMADGLNWYRYAGNNPIMYSDPTGRVWHIVAGAAIGAVISGAVAYANGARGGDLAEAALIGGVIGAVATATGGALYAAMGAGIESAIVSTGVGSLVGGATDLIINGTGDKSIKEAVEQKIFEAGVDMATAGLSSKIPGKGKVMDVIRDTTAAVASEGIKEGVSTLEQNITSSNTETENGTTNLLPDYAP